MTAWTTTPEIRAAIAEARDEGRLEEYADIGWTGDVEAFGGIPGGCAWMSESVALDYGWQEDGGCYVAEDGGHIAHCWNVLPDGRILDTTADQFREADVPADGIRITRAGDRRYLNACDLPEGHEVG